MYSRHMPTYQGAVELWAGAGPKNIHTHLSVQKRSKQLFFSVLSLKAKQKTFIRRNGLFRQWSRPHQGQHVGFTVDLLAWVLWSQDEQDRQDRPDQGLRPAGNNLYQTEITCPDANDKSKTWYKTAKRRVPHFIIIRSTELTTWWLFILVYHLR